MQCGACGAHGEPGARFCAQCGVTLVDGWATCGAALPKGAKFCPDCGARVGEPVVTELRQITAMFCDLVGSTEISTRLDPEEFSELVGRYHDVSVEGLRPLRVRGGALCR
jgi:hypothetical protein